MAAKKTTTKKKIVKSPKAKPSHKKTATKKAKAAPKKAMLKTGK